jgi:hypothetical protein
VLILRRLLFTHNPRFSVALMLQHSIVIHYCTPRLRDRMNVLHFDTYRLTSLPFLTRIVMYTTFTDCGECGEFGGRTASVRGPLMHRAEMPQVLAGAKVQKKYFRFAHMLVSVSRHGNGALYCIVLPESRIERDTTAQNYFYCASQPSKWRCL